MPRIVAETRLDVHAGNLLLGTSDNSIFQNLEETEFLSPVPRKDLEDRTIYLSRIMKPKAGPLLLSDFGETRIGPGPHAGDIMPIMDRAPETLLYIHWSYPVDIWSVGLTVCVQVKITVPLMDSLTIPSLSQAWNLLEGKTLFSARKEDGSYSDGAHFAELIAALGPPPLELLNRNRKRALKYWDEHGSYSKIHSIPVVDPSGRKSDHHLLGNWSNFVPIPKEKTLEAAETKLEDNVKFLQFIRRALTWDPNARPTARQLLQDPWLTD